MDNGIFISEIRIRNFRSLKSVDVRLDWLTVLIGENNSGKTSFLEAMFAAIGAGQRTIIEDDIYLAPAEKRVPQSRTVTIDLLILPIGDDGKKIDVFPEGSYWLDIWGNGVVQDDEGNDLVAIRTEFRWDSERSEYVTERNFLDGWSPNAEDWDQVKKLAAVSSAHVAPLALYLLDAQRDIETELRSQRSFWYKMVSDPGLSKDEVDAIETELSELNEQIIQGSDVLTHVQTHLDDLYKTIPAEQGSVSITPVSRHIRDLSKGMDVLFSTQGGAQFPLARHGMGTRSLAATLTFRAYSTWRQKQARRKSNVVHPMLALEEPEAHLHPQAQKALFNQIELIPGQKIVSTHSPYICSQAKITQFRHFGKPGAGTIVSQMDVSSLDGEDIRKINRMVLNTRGEMLFARALVLFEGETEEQALPIFAEKYWGQHPNNLGVTMVGVGGGGSYLPFLRLANGFGIRWYIFSDADQDTLRRLQKALSKIDITDYQSQDNVIVLPPGMGFESYIMSENYQDVITTMLDETHHMVGYLDDYMTRMHGQRIKKDKYRDYKTTGGRERAMVDLLSGNKTRYAKPLANHITALSDPSRQFPSRIEALLAQVAGDLGLPKRKGA